MGGRGYEGGEKGVGGGTKTALMLVFSSQFSFRIYMLFLP